MSAHFVSHGKTQVIESDTLHTIHDHGFSECYDYHYSPRGAPTLAKQIHQKLESSGVKAQLTKDWGCDHGMWAVLSQLFEDPNKLNVVALSTDLDSGPANIFKIGQVLKEFRQPGTLILGSGAATHNLHIAFNQRLKDRDTLIQNMKDFDQQCKKVITQNLERKDKILTLIQHPHYKLSHPTDDHWYPLLFAAGVGEGLVGSKFEGSEFYFMGLSAACYIFE